MNDLTLRPRPLSEIANRYGLELRGEDRTIAALGPSGSVSPRLLTWATAERWLPRGVAAVITTGELAPRVDPAVTVLVSERDPADVFYELFADSAGEWETVEASVGDGCEIHPSAVIEDHVAIGDGCRVMAGAVLMANTRLGDRVTVKPNAVLGGDGLQVREIRGVRRIVPHTGGVAIGDDATIGSQTCVDRGLFGDFTTIGAESHVDNLVHVAHSVRVGAGCTIVACAEVSGSVVLGDGVWLGPGVVINPGLVLGDHAFVGSGATVVRDVARHALVYGSPARFAAYVCVCQAKLAFAAGRAVCGVCGRAYVEADGGVRLDVG